MPTRVLRADDSVTMRAARIDGGLGVAVSHGARGSTIATLAERGGYRGRVTRAGDRCEVVVLNPAGGLVGGDRIRVDVKAGAASRVMMTTAAAERVYRSEGPDVEIAANFVAEAGAVLEWLPQQTVFYDGCRYRRRLEVDAAGDARVMVLEMLALGRRASGEHLWDVMLRDHWRIRRAGRLVLADSLRVLGPATSLFEHPAVGAGAVATATCVYVAPDAEAEVERCRECLGDRVLAGVSALDGVLVARWLAAEPMQLTAAIRDFLIRFRGGEAPRGW